jgi:hypothetical protein
VKNPFFDESDNTRRFIMADTTRANEAKPIVAIPTVPDIEKITQQYVKALSKIGELEFVGYHLRKQSIEFVVVVAGRVHRKLSQKLAQVEGQLYDDYPDWWFDFEHLSHRAYTQQKRVGYLCLFNRVESSSEAQRFIGSTGASMNP